MAGEGPAWVCRKLAEGARWPGVGSGPWCGVVCLEMISVYESRAGQGCFLTLCVGGKLPLDPVRLGVTGRWGQGNGPLSGASGRVGGRERRDR